MLNDVRPATPSLTSPSPATPSLANPSFANPALPGHSDASPLTPEMVAAFNRQGWLIVRGFFSAEEIARISDWTDEVLALPEIPGRHMVYHEKSRAGDDRNLVQRIEYFCGFHAEFSRLVLDDRLKLGADQLLGGPTCLFKEKINFKMPGGAGFDPHQDQQAGWSRYAPLFLTALVCIDRATVENGCLDVASGDRLTTLIAPEWRPINEAELAPYPLGPILTEPGDVIFFDSYAVHGSKQNRSDTARRILYLTYNLLEDGDHREVYFAEKRANFPPDIERLPGQEYKFRV